MIKAIKDYHPMVARDLLDGYTKCDLGRRYVWRNIWIGIVNGSYHQLINIYTGRHAETIMGRK